MMGAAPEADDALWSGCRAGHGDRLDEACRRLEHPDPRVRSYAATCLAAAPRLHATRALLGALQGGRRPSAAAYGLLLLVDGHPESHPLVRQGLAQAAWTGWAATTPELVGAATYLLQVASALKAPDLVPLPALALHADDELATRAADWLHELEPLGPRYLQRLAQVRGRWRGWASVVRQLAGDPDALRALESVALEGGVWSLEAVRLLEPSAPDETLARMLRAADRRFFVAPHHVRIAGAAAARGLAAGPPLLQRWLEHRNPAVRGMARLEVMRTGGETMDGHWTRRMIDEPDASDLWLVEHAELTCGPVVALIEAMAARHPDATVREAAAHRLHESAGLLRGTPQGQPSG
jgi:hypothetical protein